MENLTKENNLKVTNEAEDTIEMKRKKENNIKVYKWYRVIAYDLIFYYAIIYLFLTIEKKITPAQVLQFDAFYIFFRLLTQPIATILIRTLGKRNSLVYANALLVVHMLVIMFAPDFLWLLFSQLLCAISYSIKATCETDLLYDSIPHGEKRGSNFAKIDGKATSRHYYIEGLSSIAAGFLFVLNPYLPLVMSLISLIFTALLSIRFENIQEVEYKKVKLTKEIKNLKKSSKEVLKSNRLRNLLIFNALMIAMIKITQNLRNTVLVEVGMPEQYFGVIFAIMQIISGIATRNQDKIHKRNKNKTLTVIAFPTALSILILGIILAINIKFEVNIIIILCLFLIQYILRGPYYVLIKRYLNNFTNSEKRVKIATVNNIIENLIASILLFLSSFVLDKFSITYTLIIIGCISVMLVVLMLDRMRTTVGLKPEQYSKKELMEK